MPVLKSSSSVPPITATGAKSSDISSSLNGNLELIESQINLKNNDYINVRNAIKILENYSNWNGYIKLYTEVENNFITGDTVYITYINDVLTSGDTFNLENPAIAFADFYLGYKVLYTNIHKNEIVINRYYNDITSGKLLKNQFLSKISCRGGNYYDGVADGVVFYNSNVFDTEFTELSGTIYGSLISGATLRCFGVQTTSDENGKYSFRVPAGISILLCRAPGYISETLSIETLKNIQNIKDISLLTGSNSISITASTIKTCQGNRIYFTANTVGYTDPITAYQWKVNGINVGTDNSTFSSDSLSNNDIITCVCSDGIDSNISNEIAVTISPYKTISITIGNSNYIVNQTCYIKYGEPITFIATTGTTCVDSPDSYQWFLNGGTGTSNSTYTLDTPIDGDIVFCQLTSGCLCTVNNPVNSNRLTLKVRYISIFSNTTNVCAGNPVYFYSTAIGYREPIYDWRVNGTSVGSSGPTFGSTFSNYDIITCWCRDNADSYSADESNFITILPKLSSTITITSIPAAVSGICYFNDGDSIIFNKIVTGACGSETFEWFVNGLSASTAASYTLLHPVPHDTVYCISRNTCECVDYSAVTSNTIQCEWVAYSPTVTTSCPITDISNTTATGGGEVTSDGDSSVTERGICWSTSPNPTTASTRTIDGTGVGVFISYMTGLTPGVTYHVRAYAINSIGTSYGSDCAFNTILGTVPTVITGTVGSVPFVDTGAIT